MDTLPRICFQWSAVPVILSVIPLNPVLFGLALASYLGMLLFWWMTQEILPWQEKLMFVGWHVVVTVGATLLIYRSAIRW